MLAVRRGAVGALASGDARVRRACGAVRKGARAEAGWCRAPHARAEGFMGVRLRTFFTHSRNHSYQSQTLEGWPQTRHQLVPDSRRLPDT